MKDFLLLGSHDIPCNARSVDTECGGLLLLDFLRPCKAIDAAVATKEVIAWGEELVEKGSHRYQCFPEKFGLAETPYLNELRVPIKESLKEFQRIFFPDHIKLKDVFLANKDIIDAQTGLHIDAPISMKTFPTRTKTQKAKRAKQQKFARGTLLCFLALTDNVVSKIIIVH